MKFQVAYKYLDEIRTGNANGLEELAWLLSWLSCYHTDKLVSRVD